MVSEPIQEWVDFQIFFVAVCCKKTRSVVASQEAVRLDELEEQIHNLKGSNDRALESIRQNCGETEHNWCQEAHDGWNAIHNKWILDSPMTRISNI